MRSSIFSNTLRTFVFILALCTSLGAYAAKKYEYYGYPDANPVPVTLPNKPTYPTAVLMGGSYDVDEAFKWMIQKSGGGNFVVIRASGTDAYNPYIYGLRGNTPLTSVETLIISSREAANDPFVLAKVAGAEAIWIAGGNQSDYYNFWKDTELEKAINKAAQANVPVGGTSAGLMVLPMIGFTAVNGGTTSSTVLSNPFDKSVMLSKDFLDVPYLGQTYNGVFFPRNVVTDAHLSARERMGRLLTFMARMIKDGMVTNATARAIGVDEETALLVENGVGTKTGKGFVYFLQGVGQPAVCEPKRPLSFYNVGVQRLKDGGRFDLNNWATNAANADAYSLSVTSGVLSSTQANGSVY